MLDGENAKVLKVNGECVTDENEMKDSIKKKLGRNRCK